MSSGGGRRGRRHKPGQRGISASVMAFRRLAVRVGPDASPFSDGDSGAVDPDHAGSVRQRFSLENPDPPPVVPLENGVPFSLEPRGKKGHRRAFAPCLDDFFRAGTLELILQFSDGDLPFQKGFLPLELEQISERAAGLSFGLFRGPWGESFLGVRGDGRGGGIVPPVSLRLRARRFRCRGPRIHQRISRKRGPHEACSLG